MMRTSLCQMAAILVATLLLPSAPADVIEAIRTEATKVSLSPEGRPLPLAAHWNCGKPATGFEPKVQIRMIQAGHHLLPWFAQPTPKDNRLDEAYYLEAFQWCADQKLPITLISSQWERMLSFDKKFYMLPAEHNPNVVDAKGNVQRMVSPFGPVEPWEQVGRIWASSPALAQLQQLYPEPPLVLMLSNNEHTKLRWTEAEKDYRFAKYATDEETRRRVVGDGWIEKYQAMHAGFYGSLIPSWSEKAKFAGYGAFGPWFIGRWAGWTKYSLFVPGCISPWPVAWEGASVPYYVNDWEAIADYYVYSPQVQAMNWVPMLEDVLEHDPKFWFELSIWDGQKAGQKDKRDFYLGLGQSYGPDRYKGMVQFGMWLLRPRVVREFRGYLETREQFGSYFDAVVAAVDRVHQEETLSRFWRTGELVANPKHSHPYQTLLPEDFAKKQRWFLLDTSVDPKRPWNLYTNLPVFALALVRGKAPNREWLVYAHAPLEPQKGVEIEIPGYRSITTDVAIEGTFVHITESSD